MFKTSAVCIIAFIACSQAYDVSHKVPTNNEFKEAAEYISKQTVEAKEAYNHAVASFHQAHASSSEKIEKIHALYKRAIDIHELAPEECKGDIRKQLTVLKSSGVGSFLTCSKILEAAEDVGNIVLTTGGLVVDVIDIGRDVTVGFSGCLSSFWPWKIIGCLWNKISTTYHDITRTISDVKLFATRIETYAHNATIIIDECWNGNTVQADILSVMTPLHKCAKEPIPYDQYKL